MRRFRRDLKNVLNWAQIGVQDTILLEQLSNWSLIVASPKELS